MEKEKVLIIVIIKLQNLKVNIKMEYYMDYGKNILLMIDWKKKANIQKEKKMEYGKNIIIMVQ